MSVRDLCRLPTRDGEPYLTRLVSELLPGELSDPLVPRWEGLSRGSKIWAGGDPSAAFLRGALHPDMARDLYVLPSEALLNKSAQSLTWVSVFPFSWFVHPMPAFLIRFPLRRVSTTRWP